uniref:Uncharacterized protein n=1 Tax=Anguilla anguilla TaxID=7936 RepID=A0A0E9XVB2_ANGAN
MRKKIPEISCVNNCPQSIDMLLLWVS